jgi:predicted MPP superfamily phosphohydrolase
MSALFSTRHLYDLVFVSLVFLAQACAVVWIMRSPDPTIRRWTRRLFLSVAISSWAGLAFAFVLRFGRVAGMFPGIPVTWIEGVAMLWGVLSLAGLVTLAISYRWLRVRPEFSAPRRHFLRFARAALFAAPATALGYGVFVQRVRLQLREQAIPLAGLDPALDGLRIVQITDIHLSPFLSVRELEHAVAMANETRAHLAMVTGDLISFRSDPLNDCIKRLGALRAEGGVFGCLGNHEIYTDSEEYVTAECARRGIRFLRRQRERLPFGGATLNLAGVDYQRKARSYLDGAERLVEPGLLNVLLSHNPDVFPVAARKGFQFTIAGHTHGGQVRVEILHQDINIARFFTPYVDGLYRQNDAAIFVSRGIGTIALPARLGAPPEVALLTLRRM